MNFVRKHLETKNKVDFSDSQEWPNNIDVEVLGDTIYVKVRCYARPTPINIYAKYELFTTIP